ncbi:MAG: hypothetical protein RIK87_03590 [Fuerstiella sp.]
MYSRKTYYGGGVIFDSELQLPGIAAISGQNPTATVRIGPLPVAPSPRLTSRNWFHASPGRLRFLVPEIGQCLVTNGREVLIEPASGASDSDLRLQLLEPAFGGLLHQRGILPLQASMVRVDNCYVAFTGDAGCGKSTQAAILHLAGFPLAGDDLCPVCVSPDATIRAGFGFPALKLRPDALQALHIERVDLPDARDDAGHEKYEVSPTSPGSPDRLPLGAIYLLEDAQDRDAVGIFQVRGQRCLPYVLRHTCRYCFVDGLGCTLRHFHAAMQLARSVRIFRLRRRRGVEYFGETALLLAHHWARLKLRDTSADSQSAAA